MSPLILAISLWQLDPDKKLDYVCMHTLYAFIFILIISKKNTQKQNNKSVKFFLTFIFVQAIQNNLTFLPIIIVKLWFFKCLKQ